MMNGNNLAGKLLLCIIFICSTLPSGYAQLGLGGKVSFLEYNNRNPVLADTGSYYPSWEIGPMLTYRRHKRASLILELGFGTKIFRKYQIDDPISNKTGVCKQRVSRTAFKSMVCIDLLPSKTLSIFAGPCMTLTSSKNSCTITDSTGDVSAEWARVRSLSPFYTFGFNANALPHGRKHQLQFSGSANFDFGRFFQPFFYELTVRFYIIPNPI